MNNNTLLRLQVRIQTAWTNFREGEKGQTMVEYAGIAIVVGLLLFAVASAMDSGKGQGVAGKIVGTIEKGIDKVAP